MLHSLQYVFLSTFGSVWNQNTKLFNHVMFNWWNIPLIFSQIRKKGRCLRWRTNRDICTGWSVLCISKTMEDFLTITYNTTFSVEEQQYHLEIHKRPLQLPSFLSFLVSPVHLHIQPDFLSMLFPLENKGGSIVKLLLGSWGAFRLIKIEAGSVSQK